MKLRKYKEGNLARVREAIIRLRQARDFLKEAGATKAAEKVRKALKSAEGAERHTCRIAIRAEQEARSAGEAAPEEGRR